MSNDDIKKVLSEESKDPEHVERTADKTLGEAKAHEIRPEEVGVTPASVKAIVGTPVKPALLLAEFATPAACMHGAEKLRDAGYTKFDAHTPFPVHGMDKSMGLKDSHLGWI